MGVDHYENFPVASWLCPPALRPPIVALYRYARTADDIADEGSATAAERLERLARYRQALRMALQARDTGPQQAATATAGEWPDIFGPLARTAAAHALPAEPLHHLLDAFEQDVGNPLYPHREALLAYCARSANPVGRLLLHLWGIGDDLSLRQSDAICTALQLINFWQDFSIDHRRGRCYVPAADAQRHGLDLAALMHSPDTPATQALIAELCEWAQSLMLQGSGLALRVPGRSGWELRLVVQGGLRILETIRAMDHRTLHRRPRLRAWDVPRLLARALLMRGHTDGAMRDPNPTQDRAP